MSYKAIAFKSVQYHNFPGGPVVKNPLANAAEKGLIPGPGRPHMLQSS